MQVQRTGYSYNEGQTRRDVNNDLGKDEFLKILLTQLQHQDPLKPMEDKEFIAQMAQFSALEQMQNLSREFSEMKALSLIGKLVYAEKDVEGASEIVPVLGVVESASFIDGKTYLHVGEHVLSIDDIVKVVSEGEMVNPESVDGEAE